MHLRCIHDDWVYYLLCCHKPLNKLLEERSLAHVKSMKYIDVTKDAKITDHFVRKLNDTFDISYFL